MDGRIALLCARQHGVVHTRQLRAAGLTPSSQRRRVEQGRLFAMHLAVYSLTPTLTEDGLRAAALLATGGTLSGESVLYLHAVITDAPAAQHVTVTGTRRGPHVGIAIHRTRGFVHGDIARVRGMRTTTVGRALLDVAPRTPPWLLRKRVHEAQYRKLIDPLSLATVIETHPGHPGLKQLRAIDPAPRRAESGLETRLGRILARLPGPPPTRQFWLTAASGRRIRADFAYVEERVLVEADGRDAHARMLAFAADRARDNDVAAAGWLTLRYTSDQMRGGPQRVADEVSAVRVSRRGGVRDVPPRRIT